MLHYASNLDPLIRMAFTTQAEGNLALHVNDDPHQVWENRANLEEQIGVRRFSLRFMNQVHSAEVHRLTTPPEERETPHDPVTCDGFLSMDAREPLAVMVADCLPVLFVGHNSQTGVSATAAVHAGRKGLLDGILAHCTDQLRQLGATEIEAVIGPAICGSCYEVPAQMQTASQAILPGIASQTSWGTAALDLPRAATTQLEGLGVAVRNSAQCTLENPEYFSYRRAVTSGRLAGLIWKNQ